MNRIFATALIAIFAAGAGCSKSAEKKAAEEIRKELLSAQQSQDIVDQQRRLAEMDVDAMRKELDHVRQRYANAEGDLKNASKSSKIFAPPKASPRGKPQPKDLASTPHGSTRSKKRCWSSC